MKAADKLVETGVRGSRRTDLKQSDAVRALVFHASRLNALGVLRHVGGWAQDPKWQQDNGLHELIHRASMAELSLARMRQLNDLIVEESAHARAQLPFPNDRVPYWSIHMLQLVGDIPVCLANVRRILDALLPLAWRAAGSKANGPGPRITQVIDKLDQFGLPEAVKARTRIYWRDYGSKLKDYRDLDQHYALLGRLSYLQIRPVPRAVVLLPDDPEKRSVRDWTYTRNIDGEEYCQRAFNECMSWVDDVAKELGFEPHALSISTDIARVLGSEPNPGIDKTVGLIVEDDITTAIVHQADLRVAIGRMRAPASDERP